MEKPSWLREDLIEAVENLLKNELQPYRDHLTESFTRAITLMKLASSMSDQASQDEVLRAVVILTHAYVEDFLRTLAESFLPLADEKTLNTVPLAGIGRTEKFGLGRLLRFRDKTVETVIRESVREFLDRSNFNSTTDIASFLELLGTTLNDDQKKHLAAIEAMIQRRHIIVHRADRVKIGGKYQRQAIDRADVENWITASQAFMMSLYDPILRMRDLPKLLAEKLEIKLEIVDPVDKPEK